MSGRRVSEVSAEQLIGALRATHPELYRAWFEDIRVEPPDGGVIRIYVDDPDRAAYVRQYCIQPLVQTAIELCGHLVSIEVISPSREPRAVLTDTRSLVTRNPLNADYTFSEFVVGPSNRLAHAACTAVCDNPGLLYNPLFVFGESGLGKTHLLQATCASLQRHLGDDGVLYVACETFVNDYIQALQRGRLDEFRGFTRGLRALILDDVQFLAGRESVQEEIFHMFNCLYQTHGQLILSADCPPTNIPTLSDRLVTRFDWGLVAPVDPPALETRQAILRRKAALRGIELPEAVLDLIAERFPSNIRQLEGALTQFLAAQRATGVTPTVEWAHEILAVLDPGPVRPLSTADILEAVCDHFGLRPAQLLGKRRTRSLARPRHIVMYLARQLTNASLHEVGAHLGGRDHTTVIHGERAIRNALVHDATLAAAIELLTRRLTARHKTISAASLPTARGAQGAETQTLVP